MQRRQLSELLTRIQHPFRSIQVVYGPRQVGKTTMVKQLCAQLNIPYFYVSADAVPSSSASWLQQQWSNAWSQQQQSGSAQFLLVIDEVQKIPNWSEQIKKLWDGSTDNPGFKLILLGSSRLLLQQGLTESLAGRFETMYVGHWSLNEMQEAFGIDAEHYAWYGAYPGAAQLLSDPERWRNYIVNSLIETSISKDIIMLTRIDKPALLRSLFGLGCLYSSQELSFTKILGQLQDAGNTVTLSNYLEALHGAGLLAGLQKYPANVVRKRNSVPKFQVHNMALLSAQSPYTFDDVRSQPKQWGRVVESAIGAHLINATMNSNIELHYWREGNHEVDFVLSRNNQSVAIEVKSNHESLGTGMDAFVKKYEPKRIYLVGSEGIPWQDFLKIKPEDLF